MRLRALLVAALLAAAAALGHAVDAGWTHRMDAYTVHHLMPWRACPHHPQSAVAQLLAPLPAAFCHSRAPVYEPPRAGRAAFAVASTAAPAMVALAVVALAGLAPRGRRRRLLLVGLGGVGVATVAEVVGKLVVTRPPIPRVPGGHLMNVSTTHSFPCGHTIRACIVVYLVTTVRPSWTAVAFVWFAAVQVALVTTSGHTLSDLGGGMLVGVAVALVAALALRSAPGAPRATAPAAPAGETVA